MGRIRQGSDHVLKVLWVYKKELAVVIFLFLLIAVFSDIIIPAVVIVAMGVVASFSTSYKRVIRIPPAIELVTFTTVIVSLAYGPMVGMAYAAIVTIVAELMTNALDIFIISFVPSRVLVALSSGFFFDMFSGSIVLTGLASSILYNVVAQPFYLFLADVEMRAKSLFFIFLNVGTNLIWFTLLGSFFAGIFSIS